MEIKPYIIDSHAHLDYIQTSGEVSVDDVLKEAARVGVKKVINPGSTWARSQTGISIAEAHPSQVWVAVGVHPEDAPELALVGGRAELRALAASSTKVVAIGECGLDSVASEHSTDVQEETFRFQLRLAAELALPIILHIREPRGEFKVSQRVLEIITAEQTRLGMAFTGVAHSFAGHPELGARFRELGFKLGFNGIITFGNADDYTLDCVRQTPLSDILLETDAPFLSPHPHRGQPNQPVRTVLVAQKVAELKNISEQEVAKQTSANVESLFNLL